LRLANAFTNPGLRGHKRHAEGDWGEMDLTTLFIGFHPDEIFQWFVPGEKSLFSVDMAELVIVFGTIAGSLGVMVWFGNWWSR
jgi:hypothetical protein